MFADHVVVATAGQGDRTQERQCQCKHVMILSGVAAESNTVSAMTTFGERHTSRTVTSPTRTMCLAQRGAHMHTQARSGATGSPFGPSVGTKPCSGLQTLARTLAVALASANGDWQGHEDKAY
jgi:hypothetical protein